MAIWAKIKFLYKNLLSSVGSTLVATSTEGTGDFDVDYLSNWLETNLWQAEDSGLADPQYITLDMGANLGSELLSNVGFETAGAGGADIWGSWVENASDGALEIPDMVLNPSFEIVGAGGADVWTDWDERASDGAVANETTLVNSGTDAAKLTQGAALVTDITQTITVTPEEAMTLTFYTAGDGVKSGRYKIYDVTNSADIVAITDTGIPASAYSQITKPFTVPVACTSIRVDFYPGGISGNIAYFDDVSLGVDTAFINSGSSAVKMTQGAALDVDLTQAVSVTAGDILSLSFYSAGDGTAAGRYKVYDVTNTADIVAITSTGIVASTYSQVTKYLEVPVGCTSLRVDFYPGGADKDIAYFDDITLKVDTPASTSVADYLAILGHNLNTVGATITLQHSYDNFDTDVNDIFSEAVSADTAYLKEFTSPGAKRFWRLKIAGHGSVAPYMCLCVWGEKTELDYATSSYDPYSQNVKANINLSYGGVVTGIHKKYTERKMDLKFSDADSDLYDKVEAWWETHGLKNFFVAWETANNSTDVFLMRPSPRFHNPLTNGGLYRDITINLTGRKE